MDIVMAMAFFFIIVTMIFVAVAVFLPEWLGITGKRAKQIIAEQQAESKPPTEEKSVSPAQETKTEDEKPK
jgi:lipopolysaccharide export LptBFGC system permease protein LptF